MAQLIAVAAIALFLLAVAWPLLAGARLLALGGELPPTFDGARTLVTTAAWSCVGAAASTLIGWPVGRAIRTARGGNVMLACSVVAAALPPYAVFWTWWQAAGPGSMLGDWCAVHGHSESLRSALLLVGLASWAWPLAAWFVAARRVDAEAVEREIGAVDGEGRVDRLRRAWRADRGALALAFGALLVVIGGSTIAFDLAQVSTFGFELRALDVQGMPAGTVVRAAWPAILLACGGALAFALWPVAPREEGPAPTRRVGGRMAWIVLCCTLAAPLATLGYALVTRGALDRFAATSMRGAAGTIAAAAVAGALVGVVACGHLLLAALGTGTDRAARVARWLERVMLAGWTITAAVPATVFALTLVAAWNMDGVGPLVYDTPLVVVLCHVGRFGVVGGWIGRLAALREPRERRDLRAVDGGGARGLVQALAPELRGAAIASALVGTALAAGEVVASARIEPPGWAWSASTLLNAIHYQQPATVLGALLALVLVAVAAGGTVAWVATRGERLRGMSLVLLLGVMLPFVFTGCREAPDSPGGPRLEAVRWFGAPGRSRGQFEYPRAMDIDPRDGTILVVDRQARVQRFRPDGSYVMEWAMPEKSLGKPTGLGVGPDGRVWVADTHYHRVICWSPEGKELLRIGSYGTEPGQFIYPCDAEVGPDGNVWVAEFGGNDRIQVFTPEGAFVRAIGGNGRAPGQFDRPQAMAFSKDGRELWVADACNHRLQVLDLEGHPLRSIGTAGSGDGELAYPYGIDLLPDGTALVTEFGNHRLQRFDMATGRSLGCVRAVAGAPTPLVLHVVDGDRVRSVPSGENALRFPWAVGSRGTEAFILDSGHSRVLAVPLATLPSKPAEPAPLPRPVG